MPTMDFAVDGHDYHIDPDTMLNVEFMAIEKATGMTVTRWQEALAEGSPTAITALVWVLRKRTEPTLKFDAVSFPLSTFQAIDPEPAADVVGPTPPAPEAAPGGLVGL